MDARGELLRRLAELAPDREAEIGAILEGYRVYRAETDGGQAQRERIKSFLAAKRIDGLSPKTLRDYGRVLEAFSRTVDKRPEEVETDDVRRYLAGLAERGLRDGSIATHAYTLRSFFGWLETEDVITRSPMRRIRSRTADRAATRHPLTADELERLREGCRDYRDRALLEFLVSSGCRLSEAVGIRTDQIDWERRSVRVLGKGRKQRTVYFSARAALMLSEYLQRRDGGETLFAATRAPHGPLTAGGIEKALALIGERAGLCRRIHPHILRHTFATMALRGGMELLMIQQLLGHADPKTTLIYARLAQEDVRHAYRRIIG